MAERRRTMRIRWMVPALSTSAVLVVNVLSAVPAPAHEDSVMFQDGAVIQHDCREVLPIVEVDYDEADDVLPEGYRAFRNDNGNAQVFFAVRRCDRLQVGADEHTDAIDFYITIPIETPDPPPPHVSFLQPAVEHDESLQCADELTCHGLIPLEGYVLEWSTNSPPHARWLRERTGLGDRVRVVPGLEYDYDPIPGRVAGAVDPDFRFTALKSARSPFHVNATVTEGGPHTWDAGTNRWADTSEGTVIIFGDHPRGADQTLAHADGTVTADDPSSTLGRLVGDEPTRPFVADSTPFLSGRIHGRAMDQMPTYRGEPVFDG